MNSRKTAMAVILAITALTRLVSLPLYPFTDNTESSYAEIAREMARSGNWVTPQLRGAPFWSKPPLHTWLTAFSFKVLGFNEFAGRLPHYLLIVLVVYLVYYLGARTRNRDYGLLTAMILSTTLLLFISAGAVMTEAALILGATLSMVGFWFAMEARRPADRIWGYLFFAGLAIGILAKGPVAVALTALPIGVWLSWKRQWRNACARLPWIGGFILVLFTTVPWFLLAEYRTPGFLRYFIIGEHWLRFTVPGWKGDLYGSAHQKPHGMIWLLWILAAFPWSLVFLTWTVRKLFHRQPVERIKSMDDRNAYLLLWAITPMALFTLCGNILWTYILPGLPAFSLLMAQVFDPDLSKRDFTGSRFMRWFYAVSLMPSLGFGALILLLNLGVVPQNWSHKDLIAAYQSQESPTSGVLAYVGSTPPFSAEFYSDGKALTVARLEELDPLLDNGVQDFFAIENEAIKSIPAVYLDRMVLIGEYANCMLLRERIPAQAKPSETKDGIPR